MKFRSPLKKSAKCTYYFYTELERRPFSQTNSALSIGILFGGRVNIMVSTPVSTITSSVASISIRQFPSLHYLVIVPFFCCLWNDFARSTILEFSSLVVFIFIKSQEAKLLQLHVCCTCETLLRRVIEKMMKIGLRGSKMWFPSGVEAAFSIFLRVRQLGGHTGLRYLQSDLRGSSGLLGKGSCTGSMKVLVEYLLLSLY